jgi:hypothetical protein
MDAFKAYWPVAALLIGFAVAGLLWGGELSARVSVVERQQQDWKHVLERLAAIDQQLQYLRAERYRAPQ